MIDEVVIVGLGMTTAVGLSAGETACSARAGTARFSESDLYDRRFFPITMALVPDDGLPPLIDDLTAEPLSNRESRLLRLAAQPLRAAVAPLPPAARRPPLLLALPEPVPTRGFDAAVFLQRLARQVPGSFDSEQSSARLDGRAGGLVVLGQAVEWIRSGAAAHVLVGGVDSYRDPYVLAALDAERRVKSDANLDGFIPGEGAGFLLLTSRAAASAGLAPLASVSQVAAAAEPGHLYSEEPYRGAGLAAAVRQVVGWRAEQPIRSVYSSMNGESFWAKELGVALTRSSREFADGPTIHHPADCFGDVGAACGPVLVGLAALGVRDGYRPGPCLVYASSDRAPRAAVLIDRPAGSS